MKSKYVRSAALALQDKLSEKIEYLPAIPLTVKVSVLTPLPF